MASGIVKQTYFVRRPAGVGLELEAIDNVKMTYDYNHNRIVLESDLERIMFAVTAIQLNNSDIKQRKQYIELIRVPND